MYEINKISIKNEDKTVFNLIVFIKSINIVLYPKFFKVIIVFDNFIYSSFKVKNPFV